MRIIKFIVIAWLMVTINVNTSFAQTSEVSVNELFKEFIAAELELSNKTGSGVEYDNNMLKLIDVTIRIIKTSPSSLEAYNALLCFPSYYEVWSDTVVKKYKELKDKYYDGFNDPDTDTAEKLFFMRLSLIYHNTLEPGVKNPERRKKCIAGLQKMKNECNNKEYQALAAVALFDDTYVEDCRVEFLNKFPNHLAIPYVKLNIISDYFVKEDYKKCIEESNQLLNQYKDVVTPEGWTFDVCCYELIAMCYADLRDFPSAQKYLALIEEKAPNDIEIKTIKHEIGKKQNQSDDNTQQPLKK